MVTSLVKGPLIIKQDGKESYFAVGPGLLEVNAQRNVLLLADAAVETDTFERAKAGLLQDLSV
jgi:F0F1-type ATP synthase epsilon subunit